MSYWFKLEYLLDNLFNQNLLTEKCLELSFNVDGVSPFHSTNTQFWPISCLIRNVKTKPFFVGIFYGNSKPKPLEDFLDEFIKELNDLTKNNFFFRGEYIQINIQSFICDAPARAYLKCIKTHSGYSSCERCTQVGEYHGRDVFPDMSVRGMRTDETFLTQDDVEHHLGVSPLLNLGIGMVSLFPNDCMHSVCLGVTKKLLFAGASKRK